MKTYLSHRRHCLLPVFNLDLQIFAFARFYFPLFCWTFFFRFSLQICGFLVFFLRFLVDIFSFAAPSPHLVTINDAHCNFPLKSSCWYLKPYLWLVLVIAFSQWEYAYCLFCAKLLLALLPACSCDKMADGVCDEVVDSRVICEGYRGTIRYHGPVPPTEGN